jgi:hypothetical protein
LEDEWNTQPEHLEDEGKREPNVAEPGKEGIPNQSFREPRVKQGREEESGRKAL